MYLDIGSRLNHSACVRDEQFCNAYENKQKSIQYLTDELYDKLSDDDFNEISEKIRISFDFDEVSCESLTRALKSICYEEAEYQVNRLLKAS